jgi:hypothetical protein
MMRAKMSMVSAPMAGWNLAAPMLFGMVPS